MMTVCTEIFYVGIIMHFKYFHLEALVTASMSSAGVSLMFTTGDVTVKEKTGLVELMIIKSGVNSRDVHVNYATLDGDAIRK